MTVAETSRENQERMRRGSGSDGDLLALDTPVVSFHVHRPRMPRMPRMMRMRETATTRGQEMDRAMETARTFLPPPERLAYYGGLGLLAVLGLVEWPIAAAIGASTMIASRAASAGQQRSQPGSMDMQEPSARTPRTRTATPTTSRASRTTGEVSTATTGRTTRGTTPSTTRASRTTGGTRTGASRTTGTRTAGTRAGGTRTTPTESTESGTQRSSTP